ncbi:hypothetical protein [Halobacillus amylolyticus]|uniref:Lipoprotein n=1 Tax=Halobacillus amylolyticus TaxID=2932259 RepID=A0ABY4HGW4_9BACI|nr:hypothetical protein [Halobacillus amylolyticus]UOR14156.1 hypothetical protein MUO15_20930 [Halobacillus amylolyticus]
MNESNVSRIFKAFLLSGIFLLIVGCSSSDTSKTTSQDENITTIETVLEHQFTGPDQKLIELLDDPNNQTIIGKEGDNGSSETKPTELDLYLEETYKSYFTEDMYDKFIGSYALGYHTAAYNNGYQLEVKNIDIKQNDTTENAYDFTVNVQYQKENSQEMTFEVTGRAHIYEEGKISNIDFSDDDGLLEALKTK